MFDDYLNNDDDIVLSVKADYDSADRTSKWDLSHVDKDHRPWLQQGFVRRRVLAGPAIMHQLFIPVIKKEQDGTVVEGFTAINRPVKSNQFFDDLFHCEVKAVSEHYAGNIPQNYKFQLAYARSWVYLVFMREKSELKVDLAFYNNTIKTALYALSHDVNPENIAYLKNGPNILYDVIMTKNIDDRKKPPANTSYSIDLSSSGNPFAGKVPKTFWKTGFKPDFDFIKTGVLTEEEYTAIQAFLSDNDVPTLNEFLRLITAPISESDFMDVMTKTPFNPYAKNKTDEYIFKNPEFMIENLNSMQIAYSSLPEQANKEIEKHENEQKQLTTPAQNSNTSPFDDATDVETVEVKEVKKDSEGAFDSPF